jgi:non-heme Fe2+,alpha-ketoglutarate-dependent halogenase
VTEKRLATDSQINREKKIVDQRKLKKQIQPEQLKELDRDLRFHPSRVETPKVLSRAQVDSFNRNGYVKGISIFDGDEIDEQRRFFNHILGQTIEVGGSSYAIKSAHIKYGKVYDTLTHPRIVACIKDLLGEEVIGWGSHYFCKLPGDPKVVSWHQDASYWPLTPSKAITVWLAIDDADIENACMRFISGSNHHGHLTYHLSEETENNVLNQTVEGVEQFGEPVDVELEAGQISMHSDLLLHSSGANLSQRRRCGLTLRYCTPDVRALADFGWGEEGVVISGRDPEGHWGNPVRPKKDFVPNNENLTDCEANFR